MIYRLASTLTLALMLLVLSLPGSKARADADHTAIVKAALTRVIQPGYGAFAADSEGSVVGAYAPRGGVVTYWDATARRFLGARNARDGCGLAPTHRGATFLLTSGEGWLASGGRCGQRSNCHRICRAKSRGSFGGSMHGHSSDKTRRRSRALVPFSRPPVPAPMGYRGVKLQGAVPQEPTCPGIWRRGLKIGGGVLAACAVALLGANILAPSSWVEARATEWLKAQTGRDLAVNGATQLSFWPSPHIEITDAIITAPEAGERAAKLSIPKLEIDLGFLGLFGGATSIERIVLERPVLALHADDERQTAQPVSEGGTVAAAAAPLTPDLLMPAPVAPKALAIEDLLIQDGTVLVHSARRIKPRRFDRINAGLTLPALSAPLVGRGQFNWRNKAVGFDFELASPAALTEQRRARLQFTVAADTVDAHFNGDVVTVPRLKGQGTLSAKTRSVRQFFAWLKGVSGVVPVTGAGELTSTAAWTSEAIALSDIRFVQENARGEGQAQIALTAPRPRIEGNFVIDDLNLGPLLALVGGGPRSSLGAPALIPLVSQSQPGGTTDWFSTPAGPSAQIEQPVVPPPGPFAGATAPRLLTPGPGVSQPSLTISMPQAAIDHVLETDLAFGPATPLFDANVDLNIRKARLGGVKIGPSAVSLDFVDGSLKATLWRMSFYRGDGRGTLFVNVADPVPSFSGDIRLQGVDAGPLLNDAMGLDRLAGQGRLTLNISGEGRTADDIALSLRGNGAFAVDEGTIDGIAPAAIIRGLESGTFDVWRVSAAKTAFSLLAGSFDINHGLARTRNLRLRSPSVSFDADGVVNLPRETLDILVNPGPVSKEQGGGVAAVAEHLAPLRIEGPLTSPRIGSADSPLMAGSDGSGPVVRMPGLVLRERGSAKRGRLTDGGAAHGRKSLQPRALAPSFAVAPKDSDGSPPLRMESLR